MKKSLIKKISAAVLAAVLTTGVYSAVVSAQPDTSVIKAKQTFVGASSNPYGGGWQNCVWGAWQLAYEATGIGLPDLGTSSNWTYAALNIPGMYVSSVPAANTIVCWSGHVGFVSEVSEDGTQVYIKEANFNGGYYEGWWPSYTTRYGKPLLGYIYFTGEKPLTYYTDASQIVPLNDPSIITKAVTTKTVQDEEKTVVRIDDITAEEQNSLKQEEKEAIDDVKKEDEENVKIVPIN